MRQVRRGVFETNSSSTHSITICTKENFERFRRGELMYDSYGDYGDGLGDELVPVDEELWRESPSRFFSYDEFFNPWSDDVRDWRWSFETYTRSFTTPAGEEMVAFGEYGHD